MSAEPRLTVIVVNWNVRDLLRQCLGSLDRFTPLRSDDCETFVVDNDSSDGSVEMVRREFPTVCVLANRENVGFGRANNQAFARSRGRYVLLLNPDTVVLDDAVARMAEVMDAHPDVGAVGSRLVNPDGSLQRWTAGAFPSVWNLACHYFFVDRLIPSGLRPRAPFLEQDVADTAAVDWVSGACLLLRRSAVGETIFDERFFMYGEDLDLCERLRCLGWRVLYAPRATVIHHHGASIEQQAAAVQAHALKGPRSFYQMHHGRSWLWLYDLVTAGGFLIRWLGYKTLGTLRHQHDYVKRAASSRRLMLTALQLLTGR
jgi:GT2 family glycosyltransferase